MLEPVYTARSRDQIVELPYDIVVRVGGQAAVVLDGKAPQIRAFSIREGRVFLIAEDSDVMFELSAFEPRVYDRIQKMKALVIIRSTRDTIPPAYEVQLSDEIGDSHE